MSASGSYRTILRSSAIMGSASVANIVIGLVRMKVAAVLLGPAGIGLIGLLQNMMAVASTLAGLGLGTAGTRQIAEASDDAEAVAVARRALFWATLALGFLGAGAFFLLRGELAVRVAGDAAFGPSIGWLALGVALTVASASQGALLQGMRRIGDLARLQITSAALSTAMGIAILFAWGEDGVVPFVIAAPLASFVLGHWYVSRLGRPLGGLPNLRLLAAQWRELARIGMAFMVGGLVVSLGFLAVRSLVQQRLGAVDLGHYQAAWAISMTYLGFVLTAMATDYYPRLTATIGDHEAATRLVNEQTEVALLLGGPALVGMMALAPLVVRVLYTPEFTVSADILRWQILGDALKIASWPLGFVMLATGASKTYMLAETTAIVVFVLGVWAGLPFFGIEATGIAFLIMYAAYLPLVFFLARWRIGFAWTPAVIRQMVLVLAMTGLVMGLAYWSELAAALVGCATAAALGLHGLGQLGAMAELSGPVGKLAALGRRTTKGMRLG